MQDFPHSPTGTTGLQKAFALAIRQAFRNRLRETYIYLDKRQPRLIESLTLKETIDPITLKGIFTIFERLKLDLSPIVMAYIGAAFMKANEDVTKGTGLSGWIPFDKRVQKVIQDNSYSFLIKFINLKQEEMKDILQTGITQGDTIKTIAGEIKEAFKITSYKSELIARSEVIKTYAQSSRMAIISGGVTDQYKWLTSKKENVCKQCRPLHNQIFNVYDANAPLPVISTHPQCNCGIVPHVTI